MKVGGKKFKNGNLVQMNENDETETKI